MVVGSVSLAGSSAGRAGVSGHRRPTVRRGAPERIEPAGREAAAERPSPGGAGRSEGLFAAPEALAAPLRAAAAARAFNAGNGYLCGQLIDRTI
jgi:hypothetical protein